MKHHAINESKHQKVHTRYNHIIRIHNLSCVLKFRTKYEYLSYMFFLNPSPTGWQYTLCMYTLKKI